MKIVHIEDFFHPDAGYQLNILAKYLAKQGHDVTIITAEMDKVPTFLTSFFGRDGIEQADMNYTNETGVKVIRLPLKTFISGRAIFKKSLFKTVEDLFPDVLYVHGNDTLTGMRYTLKRRNLKYPLVLDSHMLEMASKSPLRNLYRVFYRAFLTPIVKKYDIKIIRTQDDDYVETCLGIPLSQCPWISVGSDTLLFHPDNSIRQKFRKQNNISEDAFVVVYTGKLIESKGGKLLAEAFRKKFLNRMNKKIVLMVVGNSDGEHGKEVEDIFNQSENRIIRFSTQKYIDLPQFYQAADLSVFPRQCSLSFYDAQACGLPVVSENNKINIDRLQHSNGLNFNKGDINDFRNKIVKLIEMDDVQYKQMGENAYNFVKENYNYEYIAKLYTDILIEEVKKFKVKKRMIL